MIIDVLIGAIGFLFIAVMVLLSIALRESRVTISKLRALKDATDNHVNGLYKSIANLEDLLDEALSGQLILLKNLEVFKDSMHESDRNVLREWKIGVARVKEIYVDKWRASSRGETPIDSADYGKSADDSASS